MDDAVRRGGLVSPAMGTLLLWYWGLGQRIWDLVIVDYKAKGRNGQAGLGSTAVKHLVLVGRRPGAGLEEPARRVCAILAIQELHSQAGG